MLDRFLIGAIVLGIPLVPTIILFGALKSNAWIKGKFHDIPVQLGGAAAGYLVIVAFFHFEVGPHIYPQTARVVHVRGSMKFAPGAALSAADIKAELHPPDLDVRDGKNFDWPVTIVDGNPAAIVLQPVGHEGQTLFLSGDLPFGAPNYKHHSDKDGNIIYDEPIVFQKVPDEFVEAGPVPLTGGKS